MRKIHYSMVVPWILLLLFIFIPSVQADDGQAYEVGTNILNVRIAPDDNAEIIGKLEFGDRLIVFKEKYGWFQTYIDGKEAWVASHYLIKSQNNNIQNKSVNGGKTITINDTSVRLRSGPGTDYDVIGHSSKGDTYRLIETNGDWYKVMLDDESSAWVASWLTDQPLEKQSSSDEKNAAGLLEGYNIVLDPGHGGKDPGALGVNGEKEKNLTLDIAKTIAQKLRNEGATVMLTRSNDTYVSLENRVNFSESYWTHAFISLHYNAFSLGASNGIGTYYYSNQSDYQLAQEIQTALEKHSNLRSRGINHDTYYVLRENKDPSVLVELGFITNPNDLATIQSDSHASNVANAITEGLINYLNN